MINFLFITIKIITLFALIYGFFLFSYYMGYRGSQATNHVNYLIFSKLTHSFLNIINLLAPPYFYLYKDKKRGGATNILLERRNLDLCLKDLGSFGILKN